MRPSNIFPKVSFRYEKKAKKYCSGGKVGARGGLMILMVYLEFTVITETYQFVTFVDLIQSG